MTTHDLKTHPEPFNAVWNGDKTYEIRKDDRNFQVGDRLTLREWDPAKVNDVRGAKSIVDGEQAAYTGRAVAAVVAYKTPGGAWGLPTGLCVLGIKVLMVGQYNAIKGVALADDERALKVKIDSGET